MTHACSSLWLSTLLLGQAAYISVMAVCGQTTVSADRTHPSEGAKTNMSILRGLHLFSSCLRWLSRRHDHATSEVSSHLVILITQMAIRLQWQWSLTVTPANWGLSEPHTDLPPQLLSGPRGQSAPARTYAGRGKGHCK